VSEDGEEGGRAMATVRAPFIYVFGEVRRRRRSALMACPGPAIAFVGLSHQTVFAVRLSLSGIIVATLSSPSPIT
jgi:hypothetical protein